MHLKILLGLLSITLTTQSISPIVHNITNQNIVIKQNQQYFIDAVRNELIYLTKSEQEFLYLKIIKDLDGKELYYIQYTNHGAIVDFELYDTVELINQVIDESEFNQEIFYAPIHGLCYQKDNNYYLLKNHQKINFMKNDSFNQNEIVENDFNKEEIIRENKNRKDDFLNLKPETLIDRNGKLGDYLGIDKNNFKPTNTVPHGWFFRESYGDVLHYDEGEWIDKNGKKVKHLGLCEYISLNMIILYNELFISKGFYSNDEWDKYFKVIKNSEKFSYQTKWNGMPKSIESDEPNDSIIGILWRHNNWKINLKWYKDLKNTFSKFMENKPLVENNKLSQVITQRYGYLKHGKNSVITQVVNSIVDSQIPIILTFGLKVGGKWDGHSMVVYGYDKKTNSYLANIGWGKWHHAQRMISATKLGFGKVAGHTYSMHLKNPVRDAIPVRDVFSYNNKFYTSKELIENGWTKTWEY